jgi:hypothetical protein
MFIGTLTASRGGENLSEAREVREKRNDVLRYDIGRMWPSTLDIPGVDRGFVWNNPLHLARVAQCSVVE